MSVKYTPDSQSLPQSTCDLGKGSFEYHLALHNYAPFTDHDSVKVLWCGLLNEVDRMQSDERREIDVIRKKYRKQYDEVRRQFISSIARAICNIEDQKNGVVGL